MSIRRITTLIVVIASLIILVSIGAVSYLFFDFSRARQQEIELRQAGRELANASAVLGEYLFLPTPREKRQLRLAADNIVQQVDSLRKLLGESPLMHMLVERRRFLLQDLDYLFGLEEQVGRNTEHLRREIGGQLILTCREMSGYLSEIDAGLRREMAIKQMVLAGSILAIIGLISVILLMIMVWMRRRLLLPIFSLHQAAARIAAGDFSADTGIKRDDEIGELAASFDVMKGAVQEHIAAIAASEEHLRTTLDSIGDAVITTDTAGCVTRMNPVAVQLTGWSPAEAAGRPVNEVFRIIDGKTRQPVSDPVERVLREGKVVGLANHTALIGRDGEERQIADSGAPIRDDSGRVTGVVLVFRDVTEQYRVAEALRRNEKFLTDVFDAIQDGISVLDREMNIIRANGWMQRMYGREASLTGRKCYQAYQGRTTVCPWCPSRLAMRKGRRYSAEVPYPNAETPEGWIDLSAFPMKDEQGRVTGVIEYVKDISDRKQAENEVIRARDKLEKYAADLEQSNRELEDFAYIASHDLKEPLRGIHNFAAFLLEDYEDKLDESGQAKLHTLIRLTRRLEMLLDDLLHYSRVGQSEMAMQETDAGQLARQTLETMETMLAERPVKVVIADNMPRVICDRTRVGEVLRNLIGNAVKYNDSRQPEVLIGWETAADSGMAVLLVQDNGIGIPDKYQEKIFKIFKRLHGRDEYGGGTGSGLTLARKIIEQHGGRIWVTSEPGRGSTFRFTLPAGGENG